MAEELNYIKEILLSVKELEAVFKNGKNNFTAVDGLDLDIYKREIHALVGESGCGKTVTALSILRLMPPSGKIINGKIFWKDMDLLMLSEKQMQRIRGKQIAMIFQNPQMALNPLYKIGDQITSTIRLHQKIDKKTARNRAKALLETVKIPDADTRFSYYPYQLSGGLCQRAMIAMALACKPQLLLADEPTAALDVTVQAQILDLLLEIRDKFHMSILLISHDMGVVARMCDRVSVMYLGRMVESSTAELLFSNPKHPYTKALLKSVPLPDPKASFHAVIQDDISTAEVVAGGCRFHPRCPEAFDRCRMEEPQMFGLKGQQSKVACWLYTNETNN